MPSYFPDWRGFLDRFAPHVSAPVPMWGGLIVEMLGEILTRLEILMSDQDILNKFATDLAAAVSAVDAEIKQLKAAVAAAGTPLDFSAADTALANLQALEPPAAAPSGVTKVSGADSSTTSATDSAAPTA